MYRQNKKGEINKFVFTDFFPTFFFFSFLCWSLNKYELDKFLMVNVVVLKYWTKNKKQKWNSLDYSVLIITKNVKQFAI